MICDMNSNKAVPSCEEWRGSGGGGEKKRTSFLRDPYRFARELLDEKRSRKLDICKEELEQYFKSQYSDNRQTIPLGSPGYVPQPVLPTVPFDKSPPKL